MVRATLDADDALVVPDTRVDPRFRMNPLVNGRPGIGFYAGSRSPTRAVTGSVC